MDQYTEYLNAISAYEREFKKWESRVEKIIKRYRDDERKESESAKFNILWSNVQTLVPACFSRLPQPDVSRRFRDSDPVGRVAALILERALEFEVQHYPDYRMTMKESVQDRFLGGRGTSWVRYEPHFKPMDQVTEDAETEDVEEQLDYECAPTDYVHWKDFGHSIARTWEEVTLVWRQVFMSERAVAKRFGEKIAKKIPYDATPEDLKEAKTAEDKIKKQACIYELWDKDRSVAVWLSKSVKGLLDEKPDPLQLQDFFPCPQPIFSTTTNDSLIPVPDFTLYQDQANNLDTLADRISGLVKMLQVKGVYDGSAGPELSRLFTEGTNGTLIPVKNWAAFAEKQGLKGAVDVLDLTMIANALEIAVEAFKQEKAEVDELSGVIDVMRGQVDPKEKLGQTQMKGQGATLRLSDMQKSVAQYATDILRLKAQIMCTKFAPQTILAYAAVDQLTHEDQQYIPQAMALLVGEGRLQDPEAEAPNPLRSFRIEIAADSLIELDEQQEKQDRMEMLTAFGGYLKQAAEVGAMAPALIPLIVEVGKFGLQAFKVGKSIEGTFDTALDQLKQQAAMPQQDPEQMKKQIEDQVRAELEMKNASKEVKLAQREADLDIREMKFGAQQEVAQQKQQMAEQSMQQQADFSMREQEMAGKQQESERKLAEQEAVMNVKGLLGDHQADVDGKLQKAKLENAQASADEVSNQAAEQKNAQRDQRLEKLVQEVITNSQEVQQGVMALVEQMKRPKKLTTPEGRVYTSS